jgi:hypothetical protein
VVVTRRLPSQVEEDLTRDFEVRLNRDDRPLGPAGLQDALRTADALLCTVTDRLTAEVLSAEPLPGGRMNQTWKIAVSGRPQPFVLRGHMQGEETARREWELARLLHGRVPVPGTVWAGFDEESGRPVSIQRFVDGAPVADVLRRGN